MVAITLARRVVQGCDLTAHCPIPRSAVAGGRRLAELVSTMTERRSRSRRMSNAILTSVGAAARHSRSAY